MREHIELIGAIFRQAIYDDIVDVKVRISKELLNLGYSKTDIADAIKNEHETISAKVNAFVLDESKKWPRNSASDAVRNRNKIYRESLATIKKALEAMK